MKKKFVNPLDVQQEVKSVSGADSDIKSVSAFNIVDPSVCPKCDSATVETKLSSGEPVRFCTNCRVSMALPE